MEFWFQMVPGRRVLACLVFFLAAAYLILLCMGFHYGAIVGWDKVAAPLAGFGIAVPAADRAFVLRKRLSTSQRRKTLFVFVILVFLLAVVIGLAVGVQADSRAHQLACITLNKITCARGTRLLFVSPGEIVGRSAYQGAQAFLAVFASLLLLDDLDEVRFSFKRSSSIKKDESNGQVDNA